MAAMVKEERPQLDLASMTERLIGEYESDVPAGSVISLVVRTVHGLRLSGVDVDQLAEVAEPLVRARLAGRTS